MVQVANDLKQIICHHKRGMGKIISSYYIYLLVRIDQMTKDKQLFYSEPYAEVILTMSLNCCLNSDNQILVDHSSHDLDCLEEKPRNELIKCLSILQQLRRGSGGGDRVDILCVWEGMGCIQVCGLIDRRILFFFTATYFINSSIIHRFKEKTSKDVLISKHLWFYK